VPSLNKLTRLVLKTIKIPAVVEIVLSAHATLTQTAAVLQILHTRDSLFQVLPLLRLS
jgi:hypothetical protein